MINKILGFFKPIQIFIQRRGYVEPRFTKKDIDYLLSIIRPGDVLGSYESGRWTSFFIPGNYDHVAGVNLHLDVVEAVGDNFVDTETAPFKERLKIFFKLRPGLKKQNLGGVRTVGLEDWLWRKNEIYIARHPDPQVGLQIAAEYDKYGDVDYDYEFDEDNDKMSCAELVKTCVKAFVKGFMEGIRMPKPIDFLATKDLVIIYNSREAK